MAKRQVKSKPTWTDVKSKLACFDRVGLLATFQDLYAASESNRAFFHARLGLGEDPRQPYKKTIDRWLRPNLFRGQQASVSKAKKAITEYKNAIGNSEELAELMVFYCERAVSFCADVYHTDLGYLGALVRMFAQALKTMAALPTNVKAAFSVGSTGSEVLAVNWVMALAKTWAFYLLSSIRPFRPAKRFMQIEIDEAALVRVISDFIGTMQTSHFTCYAR